MKNFFTTCIAFIKRRYILVSIIGICIIGIILSFSGKNSSSIKTTPVARGTVLSEISVTGKVKPAKSLDLAFERSGRITAIHTKVGEKVTEGQTLIELDNDELQAQYNSQYARLEQLQKGSRSEDLAITQTRYDNALKDLETTKKKAESDLLSAYTTAINVLQDAYSKGDDAVRNQTNDLFNNPEQVSPQVAFMTSDAQAKIDAGVSRYNSGNELKKWSQEMAFMTIATPDKYQTIETALAKAEGRLNGFLNLFSSLQSALSAQAGIDATTLNTFKTKVATGRASVVAAITSINRQKQAIELQKTTNVSTISAAENAVSQIEKELALKKSGSASEDVSFQEGQVEYYRSQIEKTILRAPFSGTITKIPFEKGDIIQPNATAISLIGEGRYQIETNVTESDISKIAIGKKAKVTLDAYGQDVEFSAVVGQIDLSETLIEGVPTYKTTLQFEQEDSRILSGLTANVDIVSERKENVLFVTTRNIITHSGKKFVEKIQQNDPSKTEEVEIQTGLKGSDGRTEVLSGLNENDAIVTQ